jgi:hypothetical protein
VLVLFWENVPETFWNSVSPGCWWFVEGSSMLISLGSGSELWIVSGVYGPMIVDIEHGELVVLESDAYGSR